MKQVFEALRTGWMAHFAKRYANEAARYEALALEHMGSVAGDIAFDLMMRYRDRANNLVREMRR